MEQLKTLDIEKVAAAIEADAGEALPGLRESLAEAKAGLFGAVHTPASPPPVKYFCATPNRPALTLELT